MKPYHVVTPPASAPTERRLTLADGGEHRLRLESGATVSVTRTPGYLPVLVLSERGVGFQATDVTLEEIDMIIRLLRGD